MSDSPLALVTGATGAVGPALLRELVRQGYRVRVLSRHPPGPGVLPEGVQWLRGDVTDRDSLDPGCVGSDCVFHLAALLHVRRPRAGRDTQYERVNIAGTVNVLDAARASGVRRVVFFSSIAVYGATPGRVTDESTPARPATLYAQSKLAAEAHALTASRHDGQPLATVLRLASVYGPAMKGNYVRLVNALRAGRFIPVGAGTNRRTLVFDRDAAAAAVLAATHPAAAGEIFNVTDGNIHEFSAIVDAICSALGRQPPRWSAPELPVRALFTVVDHAVRPFGLQPGLAATLDTLLEDVAVIGTRIRDHLGFRPVYDLRSGWQQALMQSPSLTGPAALSPG